MFTIEVLAELTHWISSALLSVCTSRMPTGNESIHSPKLFLTCSLDGFSTQAHTRTHTHAHTHTHTRMQIHTHRELGPCQGKVSKLSPQHGDISPGQEKVNEQEWFVCTRGSEHTMCFAVKLFCQLWRLRECTAHTNRLPRGSLPLIRHNHQQQMTERGGWRHRARSPLTEGDRKACWGWTGSPTYEGVGGKDAGNYLKFPRVWMQEIETEKTYAQMRSREAALHAYPERSHVMRLCITV